MSDQPSSEEQMRQLFGTAEKRTAAAMEELVRRDSFGELLARTTENAMAVTRIGFDAFDLVVRNLRLAGRRDVARLGQQLGRTEDKLERVLQEVEKLRDELAAERSDNAPASSQSRSRSRSRSRDGSGANGAPARRAKSKPS